MSEELVTVREAAARLAVSIRTIRRWVMEHRIPFLRCGDRLIRIPWREAVAQFEAGAPEASHDIPLEAMPR